MISSRFSLASLCAFSLAAISALTLSSSEVAGSHAYSQGATTGELLDSGWIFPARIMKTIKVSAGGCMGIFRTFSRAVGGWAIIGGGTSNPGF